MHGGSTGIGIRSTASFSVLDIDAASGDAALRFQRAGVNQWNIRNDPSNDNLQVFELGGGGERLRIENTTGHVVIGGGTGTTQAKLVINGTGGSFNLGLYSQMSAGSTTLSTGNFGGGAITDSSVYASNGVSAQYVLVFSDERIKTLAGRSDTAKDLSTLAGIEVTDYTYRDAIGKGARAEKKVVAQQVETVFPQAVHRSKDAIPDIYKPADHKDGWVHLAVDLKVGDRVKLIGKETEGTYDVLEVADGRFRTAFKPDGDRVFVFGREVNDFRSVDYDAIAMLNVSATQELHRITQVQAATISQQAAQITELEQKTARIADLERQMAQVLAATQSKRSTSAQFVPAPSR